MSTTKATWQIEVNARTGPPGYADDETYYSDTFISFESAYWTYINEDFASKFAYLRSIRSIMLVYDDGKQTHKTDMCDLMSKNYKHDPQTTGVSEKEFREIEKRCRKF